jgi:hypothetical protein
VLDELPFGLYIEIEGTVEAIREIEKLLAIGDLESVEETYPQLTIKYGDEINGIVEARFKK